MSLSSAFGAPYILMRDKEGKESVSVPLLTMEQIGTIIAKIEATRNARIKRIATEQKLDPEATARFREMGEREEVEITHLRLHAHSIKGATDILSLVLAPEVLACLSLEERREAAMGAIGWKPPVEEGQQPVNPSSGGASSTGETTAG